MKNFAKAAIGDATLVSGYSYYCMGIPWDNAEAVK